MANLRLAYFPPGKALRVADMRTLGGSDDLRVLLRPGHPSSADYVRLLLLTLNGAAPAPVSDSDAQAVRLKTGLAAICSRITEQAPVEDVENAINAATALLRTYHSAAAQRAVDQLAELKSVMRTMTDTITFLSESRSTVVHELTFVERQLEAASELDDIRLLRPRLAECLERVRQETARLQAETAAHSESVRSQMGLPAAAGPTRRLGSLDLTTGLPNRAAAERLLGEKIGEGLRCSLALFVPERLGFVTRRHGQEGENEILLHVAQHVAKMLPQGAWLYRWTGPALLGVKVASAHESQDDQLWSQIAGKHFEKTITTERRSALVRVTLAHLIKQTELGEPVGGMLKEFDDFVTAATRE